MPTIPLNDLGKGVNKDLLPAELGAGVWSDAVNFRFRNGFAERFDGLSIKAASSAYSLTYWIDFHSEASNLTRYVFGGSQSGAAFMFDGSFNNVARYSDQVFISSITRVGTTATLTTSSAHGRTTGDSVVIYGALPDQYNGTYTITVTSTTTFTYTMGSDPGASASPAGAYYFVNASPEFSVGDANGRLRFSGGELNGVFILNHPTDGLYYWPGPSTRMRRFPQSYISGSARVFKNYIVQLYRTVDGVPFPHSVSWSAAAEPGAIPSTFDSAADNDAGVVDLAETAGIMVDCLPLGDANIIYKSDARYAMTYIGGNDVFRFQRLPGTDGLLARDCVCDTPVGHVFLTQNADVMIHQGGEARSIADGRIAKWLRANIDLSYKGLAYLCAVNEKTEVWIAFPLINEPIASDHFPYNFAVWNWKEDTWSTYSFASGSTSFPIKFARTGLGTVGTFGTQSRLIAAGAFSGASPFKLMTLDEAQAGAINSTTLTSTLERTGLHFDDRDQFKTLHRSRWNIDGTAGNTATISHGSSKTADGTVTYATGATYTIGTTDYVDARATKGRFCAIKLVTTSDAAFSVRSADLDVTAGGKR